MLVLPPFRIEKHGQIFRSPDELRIDLASVRPGRYRVIAVHNFHVEDRNPNLRECLTGVFLAGRRGDGTWEEPEAFPIECRSLAVLGELEVGRAGAAKARG